MSQTLVIDQPSQIRRFAIASLRSSIELEGKCKGLRFRGGSRLAAAKRVYGLKGNRESIVKQLQAMIDAMEPKTGGTFQHDKDEHGTRA